MRLNKVFLVLNLHGFAYSLLLFAHTVNKDCSFSHCTSKSIGSQSECMGFPKPQFLQGALCRLARLCAIFDTTSPTTQCRFRIVCATPRHEEGERRSQRASHSPGRIISVIVSHTCGVALPEMLIQQTR